MDTHTVELIDNPKTTKAQLVALVRELTEKTEGAAAHALLLSCDFTDEAGNPPPPEKSVAVFRGAMEDYAGLSGLYSAMIALRTGEVNPTELLAVLAAGGQSEEQSEGLLDLVDQLTPGEDGSLDDYQRLLLDYAQILATVGHPEVQALLQKISQGEPPQSVEPPPPVEPPQPVELQPVDVPVAQTCPTCRGKKFQGTVACDTCFGWGHVLVG